MSQQIESQFKYFQFCKGQTGLVVGIQDILLSQHSPYQHIQVWETDILGRMMTLNGIIMTTEYDEFVYAEMMTHPALCLLGNAKRALVVGGGDGGTVRESLRHASLEQVDMVEIDEGVIAASKQFFPASSSGFSDPRLTVHVRDGFEFVRESAPGTYDAIFVDGTDPIGFGQRLYESAFFEDCHRLLTERGILVVLSESPFDPTYQHVVGQVNRDLRAYFPIVETYLSYIPTYQMGMWSFALASKQLHPVRDFGTQHAAQLIAPFSASLRYYNPELHKAAFALPNFVKRLIEG
jgi:spermidine synthase